MKFVIETNLQDIIEYIVTSGRGFKESNRRWRNTSLQDTIEYIVTSGKGYIQDRSHITKILDGLAKAMDTIDTFLKILNLNEEEFSASEKMNLLYNSIEKER
jgi:hypothetical protein